ncbi:MAG: PEGA domain-containing protein [Thermoanaerobaculaceae bacterium]|jgi:hypothetical protein|nr:PEGA domain-containing protein [Thermoanaerobaculaceae bacterium]
MRWLRWSCLLLVTAVTATSFAGDIQVLCEPGLRIYLDGALAGTSSDRDDGLFLANLPDGTHVVRVEKDGFVPQSFQVQVSSRPVEVKVEAFVPQPAAPRTPEAASTEVKQPTGNLLVTSAPQNCVVEIDGRTEAKSTPVLLLEGLAPGEHTIAFSKPGYERISGAVKIQPGAEVGVRGDLVAGKVESFQEGKGSLRVISTPEECKVRFLGKTRDKNRAVLNLSFIPAGEYPMVVTWRSLELSTNVVINRGQRTVVTVSFMKGDPAFVITHEPE